MKRFSFLSLALLSLAVLTCGCQQSATSKATTIRSSIQDNTAKIDKGVGEAQGHIANADKAVTTAATQPANPPVTTALLGTAHTELGAAKTALAPIPVATKTIDTKAVQAEQVTRKVETALVKEQNHWLGKKARDALTTIGIIAGLGGLVFGVIVFIIKTNGGGPILSAAGQVAGDILSAIWAVIRPVFVGIYHIGTLGLARFADLVNHHKAKAATAPATETPPAK